MPKTPDGKLVKLLPVLIIMAFGTFSYTTSISLALLGVLAVHFLAIDVPAWTVIFAFVIGMPVGAALELKTLR